MFEKKVSLEDFVDLKGTGVLVPIKGDREKLPVAQEDFDLLLKYLKLEITDKEIIQKKITPIKKL